LYILLVTKTTRLRFVLFGWPFTGIRYIFIYFIDFKFDFIQIQSSNLTALNVFYCTEYNLTTY
jgi:hypothetical protein